MVKVPTQDRRLQPLTMEIRDDAVAAARRLCNAPNVTIPERAQLNTLLRYAMSTPSVSELVLFIRYQAAKKNIRGAKLEAKFLNRVADQIENPAWVSDIDAIRFFLGVLVRVGYVATKDSSGDRTEHRSRG